MIVVAFADVLCCLLKWGGGDFNFLFKTEIVYLF